jgi:predicted PurR-regulated permease PerM
MEEGKQFSINISSAIIIKAVLILTLFWVLFLVKDLVLVVLVAVVIASSIEPLTKWFMRKKIGRLPAVIMIYSGLLACLLLFFFVFLPSVLNQAIVYINDLPENINLTDLWNPTNEATFIANEAGSVITGDISIKEIVSDIRTIIAGTGEGVFKVANIIFGGALSFILMMVLSFYLAAQEDGVSDFLKIITPKKYENYIIGLWKRSEIKIGYWMQGQLLLAMIVGILVYVGLTIIGVQHALLLATLAAIFELIPVFGPILASIPAILIAYVDGGVTIGIIVFLFYVIVHQLENHILYPLVVKKIIGVSPIVVILSLVIGAKLAGFLGIILSVPIASVLMEYINDLEKDRKSVI